MVRILPLLAILLGTMPLLRAATSTVLLPSGWEGDSSTGELEDAVKGYFGGEPGNLPQQAMNRSLSLLCAIRDAELLRNYLLLSASLDGKEKKTLCEDQGTWLKLRESRSRKASSEYEGGTMAPAAYGKMYLQMTIVRNKILTSRMAYGTLSLAL
jgi:uncharacterized protein YecT (DUF1311 family)